MLLPNHVAGLIWTILLFAMDPDIFDPTVSTKALCLSTCPLRRAQVSNRQRNSQLCGIRTVGRAGGKRKRADLRLAPDRTQQGQGVQATTEETSASHPPEPEPASEPEPEPEPEPEQAPTKVVRRNKGNLQGFMNMPLQIFVGIALHLQLVDLVCLARANKFFRGLLMSLSICRSQCQGLAALSQGFVQATGRGYTQSYESSFGVQVIE
ncbi:reticuline oxidase [Ceratobasidium sp. AG-Ba]|nr:reticuline oxidase [Ceratobasidium sp. AG-Ba]